MANNCSFQMRIKGSLQMIADFVAILYNDGPIVEYSDDVVRNGMHGKVYHLGKDYIGRVWDGRAILPKNAKRKKGEVLCEIFGDCAWSVQTAMFDSRHNIKDVACDMGLTIEIWSDEPGVGFREHYYFGKDAERDGTETDEEYPYEETGVEPPDPDCEDDSALEEYDAAIDESIPINFEYLGEIPKNNSRVLPDMADNEKRDKFFGLPSWKGILL